MFKQNFINLCNKKGVAPTAACRAVGLSNATFTCWTDESVPRRATLQRIADYFGVSVDYLLGRSVEKENAPKPSKTALSPDKQKIVDMCDSLSAEDLQKVIEYTEFIISKKER